MSMLSSLGHSSGAGVLINGICSTSFYLPLRNEGFVDVIECRAFQSRRRAVNPNLWQVRASAKIFLRQAGTTKTSMTSVRTRAGGEEQDEEDEWLEASQNNC